MNFYSQWEQQAKERIRALKKRLVELDSQEETESPQKGGVERLRLLSRKTTSSLDLTILAATITASTI
jgi:hypothetical protein